MKLIIGNRNYSSWSLRGWLAVRHSGLPVEVVEVSILDEKWAVRRAQPDIAPSGGTVPVLWADGVPSWNALAIVDRLDRLTGDGRFWPADAAARALAWSMAAEVQAGHAALTGGCPMNVRRRCERFVPTAEILADVARIESLWVEALARSGGPWLFGAWGAADIMFAPTATRFRTYGLPLGEVAGAYTKRLLARPEIVEWAGAAARERAVIDRFELPEG